MWTPIRSNDMVRFLFEDPHGHVISCISCCTNTKLDQTDREVYGPHQPHPSKLGSFSEKLKDGCNWSSRGAMQWDELGAHESRGPRILSPICHRGQLRTSSHYRYRHRSNIYTQAYCKRAWWPWRLWHVRHPFARWATRGRIILTKVQFGVFSWSWCCHISHTVIRILDNPDHIEMNKDTIRVCAVMLEAKWKRALRDK